MGRISVVQAALVRARRGRLKSPLFSPEVTRLTTAFRRIARRHARDQEGTALSLGRILLRGHAILKALYGAWTSEHLRISRWTAGRFMAVARLGDECPAALRAWRGVGLARLCALARLPVLARQKLLHRADLRTIRTREFDEILRRAKGVERRVTGNQRAHGLYMRLHALRRKVEATTLGRITRHEVRVRLEEELRALVSALDRLRHVVRGRERRARSA